MDQVQGATISLYSIRVFLGHFTESAGRRMCIRRLSIVLSVT